MRLVDTWTARPLPSRNPKRIVAAIIHTTGQSDFNKCLHYYTSEDGLQPHYLINLNGDIYRTAREHQVAYHAKIEDVEASAYRRGWAYWSQCRWSDGMAVPTGNPLANYRAWRETWQPYGKKSPLDLVTGRFPNSNSVGIELLQPEIPSNDIFSDAQYEALAMLCLDIGVRNNFSLDREHLLGHYDVSPMRRSTSKGGWDPGVAFAWKRLIDRIKFGEKGPP